MPEWGKYPILDVVMKLHMSISGSGDPLPEYLSKRYYGYLKGRVNDWTHYEGSKWLDFDNVILQLCKIVIRDYEREEGIND
jgi:hypothetical protein